MDFYLIKGIKDLNIYEKYMVKDNRCKHCKDFWSKCSRPSMPTEENPLVNKKTSACGSLLNNIPQIIFFVVLACGGAYLMPHVQKSMEVQYKYFPPNISLLRNKPPAIRISGIDLYSDNMKDKYQSLGKRMVGVCKERSDDVIFAFQFGTERRREDHIFALCNDKRVLVVGNAEVISRSEDFVICTEEYGGMLNQVKRNKLVSIKGIDIDTWNGVEYDVSNSKESCIIQHAIDVLESKWV